MTMKSNLSKRISCVLVSTLLFAGFACRSHGSDEDDSDQQLQLNCESVCLKPVCDPLFEPPENIEDFCVDWCAMQIEDANSQICTEPLAAYYECVDSLTCDEFLSYVTADPSGYPCMSEEQALVSSCPDVGVVR